MRGAQARNWSVDDVAESYAHWWREAGLHVATSEEAHGWRASEAANSEQALVAEAPQPAQRVAEPAAPAPVPRAASRFMPSDLVAFRAWLADDTQPEANWGGPLFLPPAQENARLLILCDMPEDGANDPALPFAPASARLIGAMLGAIGLRTEDVSFAPLAMRRAPGGLIDEAGFAALADRMRHYLALARPQAALILGDRTSRALIAAQGGASPERLPAINHAGGTVPAAAIAGLELLMRRPMAKAASWQALRLLHGALTA